MGTNKVTDIVNSKAISKTIKAGTIEVTGVIKGVYIVVKTAQHVAKMVAEMKMSIKTEIILMTNTNLFKNYLTSTSTSSSDL